MIDLQFSAAPFLSLLSLMLMTKTTETVPKCVAEFLTADVHWPGYDNSPAILVNATSLHDIGPPAAPIQLLISRTSGLSIQPASRRFVRKCYIAHARVYSYTGRNVSP